MTKFSEEHEELIKEILDRIRADGLASFTLQIGQSAESTGQEMSGLEDELAEIRQALRRAQPEEDYTPRLLPEDIRWAKAESTWANDEVSCNPCTDRSGSNTDTDTSITVYLPSPASKDPNVRTGDVIGYIVDGNGDRICVTDYLDDKIGTIKWWSGTVASIPGGWALCDSNNGTIDLSGRFIMCVDEDGLTDEKSIGAAPSGSGFRKHGTTENNHDTHATHATHSDTLTHTDHTINDHADHYHKLDGALYYDAAAGTDIVVAHSEAQTTKQLASDWQETTLNHTASLTHSDHSIDLAHDAHAAHSDTDNRPRYYVLAAIQRID